MAAFGTTTGAVEALNGDDFIKEIVSIGLSLNEYPIAATYDSVGASSPLPGDIIELSTGSAILNHTAANAMGVVYRVGEDGNLLVLTWGGGVVAAALRTDSNSSASTALPYLQALQVVVKVFTKPTPFIV